MHRAELVACANRKNRQPVTGIGRYRGEEQLDHHTCEDVRTSYARHMPRALSGKR
jgi:hypothetical protein